MDMHVHLAQEYVPKAERESKIEPEYRALFAANAASKTLMAGFTSVRNLGDGGMETISLREAIRKGLANWSKNIYIRQNYRYYWWSWRSN
jgi:imidazolonepropionase-like amidohydrolase